MVCNWNGKPVMEVVTVLILILLEYGLQRRSNCDTAILRGVLILILLEYGLQRPGNWPERQKCAVLILILLEYGLQPWDKVREIMKRECLNPYSTGIWSATTSFYCQETGLECLNPYSTGIWSATENHEHIVTHCYVLILILLEYGLQLF